MELFRDFSDANVGDDRGESRSFDPRRVSAAFARSKIEPNRRSCAGRSALVTVCVMAILTDVEDEYVKVKLRREANVWVSER